ncbi:hypothetical protein C8R45DRAFT_554828 [Mycena sanguinolenta]|nr:hypothetical protein C8R45DRAFT_554828 [Mycena sanguinolenta]
MPEALLHCGQYPAPSSCPGSLHRVFSPLVPQPTSTSSATLTCPTPSSRAPPPCRLACSVNRPFSDIYSLRKFRMRRLCTTSPALQHQLPRSIVPFSPPLACLRLRCGRSCFHLDQSTPILTSRLFQSRGRLVSFRTHRHAQARRTAPILRFPAAAGLMLIDVAAFLASAVPHSFLFRIH